jgi:plastocyanin
MTRSRLAGWAVAGGVAGALAVTGAGVAASPATTVKLKADATGQIKFNKKKLSAPAGKVTIQMMNPGSSGSPHGIALTGKGVSKKGKIVNPGKTTHVTVTLKKGKYTFYCPVPGHRHLGMVGTLTVK